ncbi:TniB family NTP-binding protein [Nostoc sp. MG11]|uniref:TniB family NTP-binding protein n=1 Tax=Nostoc sp. MG11 TaxID=2721166 RepID=UPI001D00E36A|nr:TniB family NTP-binding protein [Nostoc sp. MG11]
MPIGLGIYQVTKGTVAEIRDRTLRVLKGCGVEMLIIDEADQFKRGCDRPMGKVLV